MKTTTKLQLAIALAVGAFSTSAIAGPGGHNLSDFPYKVATKEVAMTCCTAKAKVTMACTSCKTVDAKEGEKDKKTILGWFAADAKHDCAGCGGKITLNTTGGGKGPTVAEYTHTCSKCGDSSAYVCTDHKKA